MSSSTLHRRGLSLVELLVSLAIGMLLTAAGLTLLSAQWREHRDATLALRLQQELRSTADLVTRDVRRAGHWGDAAAGIWQSAASGVRTNPYSAFAPASAASDAASFAYSRDTTENHLLDSNEQFGYRLRNGVIELQLGAGNWQALTDAGTLTVTGFSLTPNVQEVSLLDHCAHACPAGASCSARLQVRSVAVQINARAATDARVQRQLRSEVRLRNDTTTGSCPV